MNRRPEFLSELDVWDLRQDGDLLRFTGNLPGMPGARGYVCHDDGRVIVASAGDSLRVVLGVGEQSATLGVTRAGMFPYHILAPGDDVGSVGVAGLEHASLVDDFGPVREVSPTALMAEAWLEQRRQTQRSLPLHFVRTETDGSANAASLSDGLARSNLSKAAENATRIAKRYALEARLAAVDLFYGIGDVLSADAATYRDGLLDFITNVGSDLAGLDGLCGTAHPVFLQWFGGSPGRPLRSTVLEGQADLVWNHGEHHLVTVGPEYCLEWDDLGCLTEAGLRHRADLGAAALSAVEAKERWCPPRFHFAEWQDGALQVTAAAMEALHLDQRSGIGPSLGFAVETSSGEPQITSISIDPTDSRRLRIALDQRPKGPAWLCYSADGRRGGVRDCWEGEPIIGDAPLHRWALPCRIPISGL